MTIAEQFASMTDEQLERIFESRPRMIALAHEGAALACQRCNHQRALAQQLSEELVLIKRERRERRKRKG